MGVLSDYLLASESEAEAGADSIPLDSPDRIPLKGIQHVEISRLQCQLTGREWTPEVIDEYPIVFQGSEEGPWVFRLPAELVDRLARLAKDEIDAAATTWWSIDEFQPHGGLQGADLADIRTCLVRLAELAKRGRETGKDLYLWLCL
jgi:hypothetical protein